MTPVIRYHLARRPSWTRSIGERIDLEKATRANILPYEELEEKLASFLNEGDEDDEDDMPKKKSGNKRKGLANKKKKYKGDI